MAKRVLLSAGDDSGDLHAANLMRAMRRLRPDLHFAGFGMARMAKAGLESLAGDVPADSAMWLRNLLRLGRYRRRLARCRDYLDGPGADLIVPVDFGGFNMYLCREAAARGVPVFYYIPPQVWAHGVYRLKKLKKWVSRAGFIYPFEAELYRRYGVEAEYVGHPLFDELERRPPSPETVAGLRGRFGRMLVGIFPGSRAHEIKAHLPVMAGACREIRRSVPEAAFAAVVTQKMRPLVARLAAQAGACIELLDGVRPAELARAAAACITKSGTVTLEIAAQGTPLVIFYRIGPFGRFLVYGLSDTPHIGLVNALAGREVCPEQLMSRPDPGWLSRQTVRLLTEPDAAEECRRAMAGALAGFAQPGASARAARSALSLIDAG